MKFSVLLPTRNRLEYLKFAVETVLRQDYSDWEIIISDNCSEDNISEYIESLADARIKYIRTDSFIPVTDNWNNALKYSTGEYVVMLGDDDGLMPNYFSKMIKAFDLFPEPDFVYVSAYFFAYPGVIPDQPKGFLRRDINSLLAGNSPFILDKSVAINVAKGYLNFTMPVASNMQFSLISRRKINELIIGEEFFKSPFPDFYATPMLFLCSSKILVYPDPMVAIGITPKSYGFFHFNNRPAEGVEFLKNQFIEGYSKKILDNILPGTSYNDSWLLANEALSENFSGKFKIYPSYKRYRLLQIVHCYKKYYYDEALPVGQIKVLKSLMTFREKLLYGASMPILFSFLRVIPASMAQKTTSFLRRLIGQHAIKEKLSSNKKFKNLLEVYEYLNKKVDCCAVKNS